jgi:hypothetical protein
MLHTLQVYNIRIAVMQCGQHSLKRLGKDVGFAEIATQTMLSCVLWLFKKQAIAG